MEEEDPVMKMYEAQAEVIMVRNKLEETEKELEKVKQQRDELQRMLLQQNNAGRGRIYEDFLLQLNLAVDLMITAAICLQYRI